jgi:hypothetical protein
MHIDLHVHSDISPCSVIPLDDVTAIAAERGLDGICITDHDTTAAMDRLTPGIQNNGVLLITGMEYTTPEGDFLLYGDLHDLPIGLPATELLTHINAREAVAVAAHPRRQERAVDGQLIAAGRCRASSKESTAATPGLKIKAPPRGAAAMVSTASAAAMPIPRRRSAPSAPSSPILSAR